MRELLESKQPRAREAIELFAYRIARELGSMAAAAGGIDVLVFTGGIGEHAAPVRARVCELAAWLGVRIDLPANLGNGEYISTPDSKVAVWILPANEELVIADHTQRLTG
jgi:acetate kinase